MSDNNFNTHSNNTEINTNKKSFAFLNKNKKTSNESKNKKFIYFFRYY